MSLLLDALKRAEQEKQLSRAAEPERLSGREPVITPAAANAPSASGLELQPLGGAPAPAATGTARSEAAAHAAQAVFQAKQPLVDDSARGRGLIWAVIAVIVVVMGAAAAYVWFQMRQLSPAASMAPYSSKRPPPAPLAQPASSAPHIDAPPPFPLTPVSPDAPGSTADPAIANLAVATPAPGPAVARTPAAPRRDALVDELRDAPAAAPARPPVDLARSPDTRSVPADVTGGYRALRSGDLAAARRQYETALARDPRGIDALLGLATVEARSGNRPAAAGLYRRALESDPRNATALAGLASLAEDARSDSIEPQLLADIGRTPGQAALRIALGDLYAAQGRWNEAQSAYFDAHRLDPANPDVAFNLAVALDHLGKERLAATYYRRALEAARGQPAQFDADGAARRAAELEAAPGR